MFRPAVAAFATEIERWRFSDELIEFHLINDVSSRLTRLPLTTAITSKETSCRQWISFLSVGVRVYYKRNISSSLSSSLDVNVFETGVDILSQGEKNNHTERISVKPREISTCSRKTTNEIEGQIRHLHRTYQQESDQSEISGKTSVCHRCCQVLRKEAWIINGYRRRLSLCLTLQFSQVWRMIRKCSLNAWEHQWLLFLSWRFDSINLVSHLSTINIRAERCSRSENTRLLELIFRAR